MSNWQPGEVVIVSVIEENGVKLPYNVIFYCPGCKQLHSVYAFSFKSSKGGQWQWNGDKVKPTFSPSVLYERENEPNMPRCHSFVENGIIRYLGDCGHALANQNVPLPENPIEQNCCP